MLRTLLILALISFPKLSPAATRVVYPAPESPRDTRHADLIELLDEALKETAPEFGPYALEPSKLVMNEARSLIELKSGNAIDVAWSSTSQEKERDLLPIRIPLRKGILGYRIALINSGKQAELDKVRTLDDLKKLTVLQGIGWGDVKIYESNGIKVSTADYENLFKMVVQGRGDLFLRGLSEAFTEYNERSRDLPALGIEQHLLIYYPWPFYCFLNKKSTALAERIEKGLRLMHKDGTFEKIFKKYNEKWIRLAHLRERRVIRIDNPLLPKSTPLADESLWFSPEMK